MIARLSANFTTPYWNKNDLKSEPSAIYFLDDRKSFSPNSDPTQQK